MQGTSAFMYIYYFILAHDSKDHKWSHSRSPFYMSTPIQLHPIIVHQPHAEQHSLYHTFTINKLFLSSLSLEVTLQLYDQGFECLFPHN